MKKLSLTLTYLLLTVFAYAQYTISGKVLDKENRPIEFATVILKKDSTIIGKSSTDSLGRYKISNIKAGHYTIISSYINFGKREIPVHVQKDTFVDIDLVPLSNHLQEVVITSKKPLIEHKMDRTVFNVENSTTAIGADALELLAKTPGVKVNQKNGIELIGKGSVNVMIDDRLTQLSGDDLANMLKSMSADDISKIEVITNPGAQYDAQGNNGLINIVTKRSAKLGYNGAIRTGYSQATYPTFFSGGNLNYNKNKFKLYGNIHVNDGSNANFSQDTYFHPTQTLEQKENTRNYDQSISGQFNVDYQACKATSLGVSYDKNTSKPNINGTTTSPMNNYTIITNANTDNKSDANTVNVYLKQLLDTAGRKITIDGSWFTYKVDNQRTFANSNYSTNGQLIPGSFSQFLSRGNNRVNTYTLRTDVELPFKTILLTTGGKLSFIDNKNDVSMFQLFSNRYQPDPTQTNLFNYTENTQALYASMGKKINKWNLQTGLRGEFTQTRGESITTGQINTKRYFELFPTASVQYIKDDKHTFSLNYGRRINRPSYDELNPFRTYLNPNAYSEGNPFLQPSFSNNIELSHTYKRFFTTSLSFNSTINGTRPVTSINNSNIEVTQSQNFINAYSYELVNSVAFNPLEWLENNTVLVVWHQTTSSSSSQAQVNSKGFGAYVATNNSISLNQAKTILGDINFWCQFPSKWEIYQIGAVSSLDIGLKVAVNKKIQVALNATDILKSNKFNINTFVNQINQQIIFRPDNNSYKISISYKFGNNKIKRDENQPGVEDDRTKKKGGIGTF